MSTPRSDVPHGSDRSGWAPPAGPAVPMGYVAPPQGLAPAPGPAPKKPSDERPTSMWLALEGAAGNQIAIYELTKNRPVLVIDGMHVDRDILGRFKVPMANGKTAKLKIKALVPGYPTIEFGGRVLYRSPPPPTIVMYAYLVPALGTMLMVAGWFGFLFGAIAGTGAGYGAAAWLREAQNKTVAYVVLIVGGLVAAVLGVLGFALTLSLRG